MTSLLLSLLWGGGALFAQNDNGIAISNLSSGAGTVTFDVRWDRNAMPPLWLDSAWVFVDYNNKGITTRLSLTGVSASAGTVSTAGSSDGAWIIGNARTEGIFSATVRLLTAVSDLTGVCAYASNYPPVGLYTSDTDLSFTGTLPYIVTLKNKEGVTQPPITVNSNNYTVPAGYTAQSFTDATGAPGMFSYGCLPGTISGEENSD